MFNLQAGGISSRTRTTVTVQDCGVCLQTGEAANYYDAEERMLCAALETVYLKTPDETSFTVELFQSSSV